MFGDRSLEEAHHPLEISEIPISDEKTMSSGGSKVTLLLTSVI